MAKLILIRGLPGSGKSTMARDLIAQGIADCHVETDMFFCDAVTGAFKHDVSRIAIAHAWCLAKVKRLLSEGKTVVVSNTFTMRWEMQPYTSHALLLGLQIEVLTAKGEFQSVHGVPATKIAEMRSRWED